MYRSLMFLQGDDAIEYLALLDTLGVSVFLDCIADALDWNGETFNRSCSGPRDRVDQVNRYTVSSNVNLRYIGVEYFHFNGELA